jgi:dimeric dUTPase (all-alpha-NTP-PPase superfamily)
VTDDPLHDALVAIFQAIAEREEKTVEQAVEEFFSGYVTAATEEAS